MNKDFYKKIVSFVQINIKVVAPVFLMLVSAIVTYVALSARDRRASAPEITVQEPVNVQTPDVVEETPVPIVLTENTDAGLSNFFSGYYLCHSNGDVDTLETMIDSLDLLDKLVKAEQNIVDAVCSKGDTHTGNIRKPEDTGQVIVPSATADASDGKIQSLHFKDGPCVIVKSAGQ